MFRTDGEGNAAGQFGERRLVCFAVGVVEVRTQWKRRFSSPSMALKRTTLISTNQIIHDDTGGKSLTLVVSRLTWWPAVMIISG